jgi:hypothetical protein
VSPLTEAQVTADVVCDVDPRHDGRWADLVGGTEASLFASPPWMRALHDGFDLTPSARIVLDAAGRARAGLAFVEIDDEKGRRVSSLPFSDFSDPLGRIDAETWQVLRGPLATGDQPFSVRTRCHQLAEIEPGLTEVGRSAWHGRRLEPDQASLWEGLAASARQNVRRAQREGVTIEVRTDIDAVLAFHRLHVALRKRKYRMLAQPAAFFSAIADHFGREGNLAVVRATRDDELLASVVLLRWDGTAYYKFNAATERGYELRANDLVMWESLRLAQSWGCRHFDFGLSGLDQPGLLRYKQKYATDTSFLVTLRRPAAMPAGGDRVQATVDRLVSLLTEPDVPDEITARAGDELYRLFC